MPPTVAMSTVVGVTAIIAPPVAVATAVTAIGTMATAKPAVVTVTAAMAAVRAMPPGKATMPSTMATMTATAMAATVTATAMTPTMALSLSCARTRNKASDQRQSYKASAKRSLQFEKTCHDFVSRLVRENCRARVRDE